MPIIVAPQPPPPKPRPRPPPTAGPLSPKEELAAAKSCTIFFSYHPRHRKEVRMLRRLLENQGLACWMHPGGMSESDYMREGVEAASAGSRVSLVCLDRAYVKSEVCTAELQRILAKQKAAMVPLRFEAMEFPPKGPQGPLLKNYNTVPFYLSTNEKPYRSHPWSKRGEDALMLILKYMGIHEPQPYQSSDDDYEDDVPDDGEYQGGEWSSESDAELSQSQTSSTSLPPIKPRRSPTAPPRYTPANPTCLEEEDGGARNPRSPSARGGRAPKPSYFNPNVAKAGPTPNYQQLEGGKLPSVYRSNRFTPA